MTTRAAFADLANRFKIREKTIVLFLLCALVPLGVVSIASFATGRQTLKDLIVSELLDDARAALKRQELLFARAALDLETWRELQVMQDVLVDDDYGDIRTALTRLREKFPYFGELMAANQEGSVVAATGDENVGTSLLGSAPFVAAQSGRSYRGLVEAAGTEELALMLALPIRADYDQETIVGALIGVLDLERLRRELGEVAIAGAPQDADHLLIVALAQRPAILYQTVPTQQMLDRGTVAAIFARPATDALDTPHGTFIVRSALTAETSDLGDLALQVHAAVSTRSAYASISELRLKVLLISLVVSSAAIAVGWLGGSSLVQPLRLMIGAMNRLAQGEHQVAIPALRRRDEIGEMAAALAVFRETAVDRERKQLELIKAKEAAEAAERQVRHLAHHDFLTGLANRVTFKRCLSEAMAMARRRSEGFAVLFLDLDRFKEINDTMGHLAGDAVLCEVSERLRRQIREVDTLARMGGDEFAIIQLEARDPKDVAVLCERLIEAVEQEIEVDGAEAMVGLSIGVALFPGDATEADQLLARADVALYRAKGQSRGTYCFFQPEMAASLEQRKLLERDLRHALVRGEFALEYQPQIRIADRRLVGVEALLRWQHPKRGRVPPDRFIPLAEDTGLIQPIGTWALETAAADAARWQAATACDVRVAVNLSPVQFRQRHLFQIVCDALRNSNLAPEQLKLEITERLVMQASELVRATLCKIKDLGVRVSMDDFGTGYSSMGSLRQFPFDEIKIDRSFIADLPNDPQSVAIVRATVALSNSLGMLTVAEGIETLPQLDFLRAEGCHVGQGFLFARPMPAAEVVRLLASINEEDIFADKGGSAPDINGQEAETLSAAMRLKKQTAG